MPVVSFKPATTERAGIGRTAKATRQDDFIAWAITAGPVPRRACGIGVTEMMVGAASIVRPDIHLRRRVSLPRDRKQDDAL